MRRLFVILAPLFFATMLYGQQAPVAPKFRLPDIVRPTHYTVDLTVVPAEENFSGKVSIDVELREAASVIWLHGVGLTVDEANISAGGQTMAARPVSAEHDFLGFSLDHPVGPGKASLRVAYHGPFDSKSSSGLFKNKEGDEWYAVSQFESTDARRAFPCFDEPSFKVPWQLTLHVRKEHRAFSNTPAISESDEANGMKAVKFAETKPLPSYLVALAVGPFETVDGGKAGKKSTPIRVIVPRGKSAEARYAAEVSGQILAALEDYFGIPYPYEKLDTVAVPMFDEAMENPGLVTFGQTMILAKPDAENVNFKRDYSSTAAHEFAHQWFGDLVTTAWWDDIWLNEGFATWMEPKIISKWKPEWREEIAAASDRLGAMGQDSLVSARKIRQPIESTDDIANAFDGITYDKAAAVIFMFEHWVGPETFRKGVQLYMQKHAYSNATAADFLAAISEAAGRDVAPAFSSFLDQAGVPLVSGELRCDAGKPPALTLTQKRYLPLGSQGSAERTWHIPVCLKYGDAGGGPVQRECTMLDQPKAEVLLKAKSCPSWLVLNDEESGYYRTLYRGDLLGALLKDGGKVLSVPERIAVISDVRAGVVSGDMTPGEALKLVPQFAGDPNREVVTSRVGIAFSINNPDLVPEDLWPNYARFVQQSFGEQARGLGWQPKPGEDDDTRLLRPALLNIVANVAEDKTLLAEADRLVRRWLDDRRAVSPDMIYTLVFTAARHGDRSLYDRFHAELNKTKDEEERSQLLTAMAYFGDPAIAQANFDLFLSGDIDPREGLVLLLGPRANPKTRDLPFQFLKANYDRVVARLPNTPGMDYAAFLPQVAAAGCDEQHRAEAESFFKERSAKAVGGPRILAQVLESISLCSARVSAQRPAIIEFLKKY